MLTCGVPPALGIPSHKVQLVPWTNKFEYGDTETSIMPYNAAALAGLRAVVSV